MKIPETTKVKNPTFGEVKSGAPGTRPPSKLTAILMRILAVATILQVLFNTRWMVRLVRGFWRIRNDWGTRYPQYPYLFPSLILLNFVIAVVLVLIAISLWKLNKKSLFILSGLLALEFAFIVFAVITSSNLAVRYGVAGLMTLENFLLSPNSMLVIWSQARTGYLLFAPALIIAIYLSRRFSRQTS